MVKIDTGCSPQAFPLCLCSGLTTVENRSLHPSPVSLHLGEPAPQVPFRQVKPAAIVFLTQFHTGRSNRNQLLHRKAGPERASGSRW